MSDEETRLYQLLPNGLLVDGIDEPTFARGLVVFDTEFVGFGTERIHSHFAGQVDTGLLLEFFEIVDARERLGPVELHSLIGRLHTAISLNTHDFLVQSFHHFHTLFQIEIRTVTFHEVELLQMLAIDTLVAEYTTDLEDTLISADKQSLQRELERNTQIEIRIKRVVMRDERFRFSATRHMLQDGRLYLEIAFIRKESTDGLPKEILLHEQFTSFRIRKQIEVTATKQFFLVLDAEMIRRDRSHRLTEDAP